MTEPATAAGRPRKAADSARWCERCQKWADHHTDRHDECAPATAATEQYAWPFEEASEDDRFAHMAGAHGFLFDGVDLHAKLHEIGQAGRMPHEHLTPLAALMLRHMNGDADDA